jgi:hypothetical protein
VVDLKLADDTTCHGDLAMYGYVFGWTTILSLAMALMLQAPAWAQGHREEATGRPQEEVEEVQEDYFEVWGTSTTEPNRERPWSESFDSEAKAQARLKELERDYAKGGLLESATDKPTALKIRKLVRTVRRIKKAKDAAQGKAKERKVGDTLREYAKNVAQAYERAKRFKEQRLASTKQLSKQQMDEVNARIKSYNKTRDSYGDLSRDAVAPVLSKYPAMPLISDKDLDKNGTESKNSKYTVWVFKQAGGRWEKQEDRTLNTDDKQEAKRYVDDVKAVQGWTATSNLPQEMDAAETLANTVWDIVYSGSPDRHNTFRFIGNGTVQNEVIAEYGYAKWKLENSIVTIIFTNTRTDTGGWTMQGRVDGDTLRGTIESTAGTQTFVGKRQ